MIKTMMIMVVMAMMMGITMGDTVDKTSKQTPDYTLCISLLRSDPRSYASDTVGLGLILVDKIKALGSETLRQINMAYQTKPMLERPLDEYNQRYKTIVDVDVHTTLKAIRGNAKFAEGAVVDDGIEASVCDEGFPKANLR